MRPIFGKEIDSLPIQTKGVTELQCSAAQFFRMWEDDESFIEATGLKMERTCDNGQYEKGFSRKITTKDGFVVEETFTVFDRQAGEICFYGTKATLFGLIPVAKGFAERLVMAPNNSDNDRGISGCVLNWQVAAELNMFGKLFLTSIVQKANDKMVHELPKQMDQVALKL